MLWLNYSFQAAENLMYKQTQLTTYFRMTKEEDRKEVYIYIYLFIYLCNRICFKCDKVCQCSSGGSHCVNTLVTNQSISHEWGVDDIASVSKDVHIEELYGTLRQKILFQFSHRELSVYM